MQCSRRVVLKRTVGVPLSLLAAQPCSFAQSETESLKIGVLLEADPSFLRAARSVALGVRAAHQRDGANVVLESINMTGGEPISHVQNLVQRGVRVVIGPLTRAAVNSLADLPSLPVPVLALNQPDLERRGNNMISFGLPIETEARQIARHGVDELRNKAAGVELKAVALHNSAPISRRAAQAFADQWQRSGGEVVATVESESKTAAEWRELIIAQTNGSTFGVAFAAVVPEFARSVRNALPKDVMMLATSQMNTTTANVQGRSADLEGWRLTEMPWQVSPDHPAVMIYSRSAQLAHLDFQRLYALGIDAFRVARELAAKRTRFDVDGVTGRLRINLEEDSRVQRVSLIVTGRNASLIPLAESPNR
jgi:uncharacterized protein